MVPGTGLEPVRLIKSGDFKSPVSTNSTTRALGGAKHLRLFLGRDFGSRRWPFLLFQNTA
jgi:hypothetical protein